LQVLAILLALAFASGPPADVDAIRHDLPILLGISGASVVFDRIEVQDDAAIVWFHAGASGASDSLYKRYDRWWLLSAVLDHVRPGTHIAIGDPTQPWRGDLSFHSKNALRLMDDGYVMGATFAANDATKDARIAGFAARAPTKAESWATRGGNSYCFFSGTVRSVKPIHVRAGTTIDIWFPFVLDPSLRYRLTIGSQRVDGTLAHNSLHFSLPEFTLPPGVELMGEIDSN
jgi:hypothetical protein